jgi:hypothetical protein
MFRIRQILAAVGETWREAGTGLWGQARLSIT